jgi:alpha-L-fucosidase
MERVNAVSKQFVVGVGAFVLAVASQAQTPLNLPVAPGPFKPNMESLKGYRYPTWFRDAKFGIWAHWGPQSVPMDGDWYARNMYEQGSGQYKDHIEHYGFPSVVGYKDIIPLWKAEKWDPERLMKLYKKAGAKYFVSMGSHHDDFFLWNSKIHRWNAVQMGPHRDVVGEWQKAAKKNGLHFGVSEHLGASFTWFQPSHGSDKTGPEAGVPYDGANPAYWDLYHQPAEPGDTGWYSNNPKWQQEWFNEIKELVDAYHPDLLYSDGGVPFGNVVGLSMIAELYNTNAAAHGGKVQAVYNCKQVSGGRWVEDLERGIMPKIDPNPWQTDTSIGDWFYNRNWKYRPISWVVDTLVDNVSKNGNLLLNVVQRPDGSLDPQVEDLLKEMANWTATQGEGIFGSRPWQIYGEGGSKGTGGNFKEDFTYSSKDIRFTTKGGHLYAYAMGWPSDGKLIIHSLARPVGQDCNLISDVELLGSKEKPTWSQSADGLLIELPSTPVSMLTVGMRISGTKLKAIYSAPPVTTNLPNSMGVFNLMAGTAELHGNQIQVEEKGGVKNVGYWDQPDDWISWHIKVEHPGKFDLLANVASPSLGVKVVADVGGAHLLATLPSTGDFGVYNRAQLGVVKISQPGVYVVSLRAETGVPWNAINLRDLQLSPLGQN